VLDVFFDTLERSLLELKTNDCYRSLKVCSGADFGSNDYLGFAHDEALRQAMLVEARCVGLSSSSSRLLPGNHVHHLEAERYFASFVGAEGSLFFNSGYDANFALLTTLPTRHDLILYDEYCHASWYEGAHASVAKSIRFDHNSAIDLESQILRTQRELAVRQLFIVIESIYSMDGDLASIKEIAAVAKKYSALLMIDEAHATGVRGSRGEGLASECLTRSDGILTVHTCGKALGAVGAFVVGKATIMDYLINKARPFIYTTALPPIIPIQVMNSVRRLEAEGTGLIGRLRERSARVRYCLKNQLKRWVVPDGETPIIPVIIGSAGETVRAAHHLQERGFDVPAIRPPTVPKGSSRLRLNISLGHSERELSELIRHMVQAEQLSHD
jgi:8-amino-7-oxononanoate synthase